MACERSGADARRYYRYYDTPDGCDVDKKMIVTIRYGVMAGLVFSAYDILMYTHAVGMKNIMKRCLYHTVPLGLMGATFAAVANGAQHARQKDDPINYFVGGLACGPILAAYLRSTHVVLLGGLAMGVMGYIKKDAIDNHWRLIPDVPTHMNTIRSWRNDWTLARDPRDDMIHTCSE